MWRGVGVAVGYSVVVYAQDVPSREYLTWLHAPNPVPPVALDRTELRSAEAGIGYQDGQAGRGECIAEAHQEAPMRARAVVAPERVDFLVDRDRTPAERYGGTQEEPSLALGALGTVGTVRPVDEEDRACNRCEQPLSNRAVDVSALTPQMMIPEQPVDALDVVLGHCAAAQIAPKMGQRQLPAPDEHTDDRDHSGSAGRVDRWARSSQPPFQERQTWARVLARMHVVLL